jgi:hypothetical protein
MRTEVSGHPEEEGRAAKGEPGAQEAQRFSAQQSLPLRLLLALATLRLKKLRCATARRVDRYPPWWIGRKLTRWGWSAAVSGMIGG